MLDRLLDVRSVQRGVGDAPPGRQPATRGLEDHAVVFYSDDQELLTGLARYVLDGLAADEGVIVVATPAHRAALSTVLEGVGVLGGDQVTWADAAATLAALSRDGVPDADGFADIVAPVIARAADTHGAVRIYGEMVALLWEAGDPGGALHLEAIWNDERVRQPFALLCGYRTSDPDDTLTTARFAEVCALHGTLLRPGVGLVA